MTTLNIDELHNARYIFRREVDKCLNKLFETDAFKALSGKEQKEVMSQEMGLLAEQIIICYFFDEVIHAEPSPPEFEKIFRDNMKDLLA